MGAVGRWRGFGRLRGALALGAAAAPPAALPAATLARSTLAARARTGGRNARGCGRCGPRGRSRSRRARHHRLPDRRRRGWPPAPLLR
ncbi:MAG: hypothetical protein ACREKF_06585, partial [Candidatus Methylomirabilales bacterium]